MGLFTFLLLSLLGLACYTSAEISPQIGVCYGQLEILKALKGTDLQVSVMVPNEIITNISSNQTLADQWVLANVVPFYPETMIRYLLVGNEILSQPDTTTWFNLVPAMRRIKYSVKKYKLHKIKVGTPLAMDVLESSFPPSNGTFRSDVSVKVVKPLLQFLNRTKSFFFLDVYTFFPWSSDPINIKLDYALLMAKNITYTDPVSGLTYTNLLDQMLDSVVFAMKRLGYPNIRLFIAETGWPNGGDIDQIGCNIYNAATYNRNVVKKLMSKPPVGTPARPGTVLPAFLFALYNENQKPGPGTERHFGLLYPNEKNVYEIDLSAKTPESEYKPLPIPTNNEPYKGKIWCVVAKGANRTELASALSYACGQGNGTCDPIQPGGKCYKPIKSLVRHASLAFSSYWAQFRNVGGTCYFNGLAIQTAKDPSYGSCKFPSVTL
ncbi:unnamed protein product [Ilex paraguariensis]|uniref:X8 domain-containing protein n=1 Tax=Ilex paraguariensis TaxID=185542 RepID=A0ABC8U473_9AQUA